MIEETSSGNTLGIALPASGLKMQKLNLQDANEITSPEGSIDQDKVNLLSPGDMRLQVINPSNKLEMADPVQVKTLITAEQDPNDKDIQDTISKYNDAIKIYLIY